MLSMLPIFNAELESMFNMPLIDDKAISLQSDDSGYHINCTLPDMSPDDIKATLDGHSLHIVADKKTATSQVHYERSILLPADADVHSTDVNTLLKDGLLTVNVPKGGPPRVRQLELTIGQENTPPSIEKARSAHKEKSQA